MHIAHLINPVLNPVSKELSYLQPLTFESIRLAKKKVGNAMNIELLTAQYSEDIPIIPQFFQKTENLERSVLDFENFSRPQKLPLLRDLIERLYNGSAAKYLIYTNADICVQQDFYLEVAKKIESGLDAFIINRRRIPSVYNDISQLPEMYANKGRAHPGFDCFIFDRALYPKFQFENVCIGIPFVEMVFSQNLFCYANHCKLFDRDHLTFHVGMEVFKKRDEEFLQFNKKEFWKAMFKIWPQLDSRKFPWGDMNFFYRMFRWGLHPAIPIKLALKLELKRWRL